MAEEITENSILTEYKDNQPKRILELLKLSFQQSFDPEMELLIKNIEKPQNIIDKALREATSAVTENTRLPHQLVKTEKDIKTSEYLLRSASLIETCAGWIDIIMKPHLRSRIHSAKLFNQSTSSKQSSTPKSNEGNTLRKLSKKLKEEAHNIFNLRPVIDDDPQTVAETFLSMDRIKAYIASLPDDKARLVYLKKMERAYQEGDERTFVYVSSGEKKPFAKKAFKYRKNKKIAQTFPDALQSEIKFYEDVRKPSNLHAEVSKALVDEYKERTNSLQTQIKEKEKEIENLQNQVKELKENLSPEKASNGLTHRQWMIAANYFFKKHEVFTKLKKINIARFLTVLNNGKNFQEFRTELEAKDLITKNTVADAQAVADLFRKFKQDGVADNIEVEINKSNLL